MGQAKIRGSRQEREAESIARQSREVPAKVPCKTCQSTLSDFVFVSASPAGAIWQSTCACGAVTKVAVQSKHSTLARVLSSVRAMDGALPRSPRVNILSREHLQSDS